MTLRPAWGSGRHHQVGEFGGRGFQGLVGGGELLLEWAALVVARLGEQLPGGVGVGEQCPLAAGEVDDRRELVVPACHRAQRSRVADDRWVGEARFEVGVLVLDGSKSTGDGIGHGGRREYLGAPSDLESPLLNFVVPVEL